jgi:hypothetical protein
MPLAKRALVLPRPRRHFDDKRVELRFQRRGDHRLVRQAVERAVPRPPVLESVFERVRDQLTDFVIVKWDQLLVGIIFVELRAEEHRVDARIEAVDLQEIFRLQKHVAFLDDFALSRRAGDAKLLGRRAHDGSCFEQDEPVVAGCIVRIDGDQVAPHRFE